MVNVLDNARATTGTTTRLKDVNPQGGICTICVEDCNVLCEISKSAFRGREVLYPNPEEFGKSTQSGMKDYFIDWSHFQILPDLIGAKGIEPDPDKAIFPNADISTVAGGVLLRVPVIIAGLGSTPVARRHWEGIAIGAALSGTIQTVGENVCGMDPDATYDADGKVVESPDMRFRVETYRRFWDGKHGDIVVQTNVEDEMDGTDLYVLSKLEVSIIERKWGQGAKAIGGEVRLQSIERALQLKERGYVVLPEPTDPNVQEAFRNGVFNTFERHSRVGMPKEQSFVEGVELLREHGAKKVFLKTGAYRPAVVAYTMRCASEAKIDLVTFDGAGGGTAMSPVSMMNEMSTPTVMLEAQVLKCCEILKRKGKHVPDIAMAGGFVNEGQILKAIAMSNLGDGPFVKTVAVGRPALTAAMKAGYFARLADERKLPRKFVERYTTKPEKFFITASDIKREFPGKELGKDIPWSAIGVYTYFTDRIGVGLQQLLAGIRKFRLDLVGREDIGALTEWASKVTDIPTINEIDADRFEEMLDY